jgi:lipoprotein-releasing system permease protein
MTAALGSIEIRNPMIDITRLPLAYSPLHYALATAVALASSFVAGYFPARKASRLYPVDIIRGAT